MANIKSAKKRIKQTKKRTMRNRANKERLKKAVKAFRTAVGEGSGTGADEIKKMQKAIDRAGDKGVLHRNAVNRRKSRLMKAANRAAAAQAK